MIFRSQRLSMTGPVTSPTLCMEGGTGGAGGGRVAGCIPYLEKGMSSRQEGWQRTGKMAGNWCFAHWGKGWDAS